MGHAQSRPTTAAEDSSRLKEKGSTSRRAPFLDTNRSASAWTNPTSRLSRLRRSHRTSTGTRTEDEEEKARQREEVQRYLADAIEQQREAEQTLAETRSASSVPRLVLGDYGAEAGGLDALKLSSSRTVRPGSSGSARSAAPGMSLASSSFTRSNPSHASRSPAAKSSRWSESSGSSDEDDDSPATPATPATPSMPFTSFRNSLNRAQRDRLSVLLAHPDKLDEADVAVASAVLYGHGHGHGRHASAPVPASAPLRRLKSTKVRGPIRIVAAAPMSANRYAELEQRRAAEASSAPSPRVSPRLRSTPAEATAELEPLRPEAEQASPRSRSSDEDLSGFIAASPQLAFPGSDGFFPHGESAPPLSRARSTRAPSTTLPPTLPPSPSDSQRVRLGRLGRLSVATALARPSAAASPTSSRRPPRTPTSPRPTLGSVAEDSSSSSPSPTGAEVPVCLSSGVISPASPNSALSRPSLPSSSSSTSFPRSVGLDDGLTEASSPVGPPAAAQDASPDSEYFDARRATTTSTAETRRPFSRHSLAPSALSLAESDLPPATLDAFPAPPSRGVARVAQEGARDSLLSNETSSTEHCGSLTPSTSLSRSTAASTVRSLELPSLASRNAALANVDFSVALEVSTFVPAAAGAGTAKVADMVDSPAASRASSSLETFVLEDLVDELVAAAALSPEGEQEHVELDCPPPVPPKEAPARPRRPPHARAASTPLMSPPRAPPATSSAASSPRTKRSPSAASAPQPPHLLTGLGLASYRFPPAASAQRKASFPSWPLPVLAKVAWAPNSRADEAAARREGRKKRGLSRDEVGDWVARSRKESGEA